jgi:hypothetical protein
MRNRSACSSEPACHDDAKARRCLRSPVPFVRSSQTGGRLESKRVIRRLRFVLLRTACSGTGKFADSRYQGVMLSWKHAGKM